MKYFFLSVILVLLARITPVAAQVTFSVQSLPDYTPAADSLFIAGDFTGWQPGLAEFRMHKNLAGKWQITLSDQPDGTQIKFKFTRGSWDKVEKGAGGEEIPDRSYTFGTTDSVNVSIANWADAGGGGGNSTAATNVKIISTDFLMPQFNRTRRIWMYFPPDYETSGIHYPVLYMHDGQNVFDAFTAFSGEWEVDESLNKLASEGKNVPLVVAIDNGGGDRIGEYTPFANSQYGGGDGEKYMQFIVETLKPYIDQNYRTLPDLENTGIMGSSLGGLISHYGVLAYPDVFSKAGLFSPSYWFSDSIHTFTAAAGYHEGLRFYQLCGTNESEGMVADMQRMNDSLIALGYSPNAIFNKVVEGGQHNEKLWREGFRDAYLWLFSPYANGLGELHPAGKLLLYPNPVNDILTFTPEKEMRFDSLSVCAMSGKLMLSVPHPAGNSIDVRILPPGVYILKAFSGRNFWEGKFTRK
jgi:predicted alpha/beta superfamily hydrolase